MQATPDPSDRDIARLAQQMLDRHTRAEHEDNIRAALRDFLVATRLADASTIVLEDSPGEGSRRFVDLTTDAVLVEVKRRISGGKPGLSPDPENVRQLDDYLAVSLASDRPRRIGILTDGKHWVVRWPNAGAVRTEAPYAFTLSDADRWLALYEWLRDEAQALEPAEIVPTEENVRNRFGLSLRFEADLAELEELYRPNRDAPTIRVKRNLWRQLLAAALGEAVENEPDLDRLFLRHTYLAVVVGLAVQRAFDVDVLSHAQSNAADLLNGRTFVDWTGVRGVLESDFFSWPAEVGGANWILAIAKRVARFDWSAADSDIARILYESVIPKEDREALGEYYTPPWLAREIVNTVVTDPLHQRVLDPACGSGTFIFEAVRKYLSAADTAALGPRETLEGLVTHVIGIDVHPAAVHLARATWALAARSALTDAADEEIDAVAPIYLGDSLQLGTEDIGLFANSTVTLSVNGRPNSVIDRDLRLEFPRRLVEDPVEFDSLMTHIAEEIESGGDPLWALDSAGITGEHADRPMLEGTASLLQELHENGHNHIWAYYARNLVRPVWLRQHPVDVLVGNPPWLSYRDTTAVVRTELERQSRAVYKIWAGGQYATTQDIAGLFFARCTDLYLKAGGVAAMVLPHSVLERGQHREWRTGDWGDVHANLAHRLPWDFEDNKFFTMPACVAFAEKVASASRDLPRRTERWLGPPGGPYTTESVDLLDQPSSHASPYGERARQGAIIVPRCLFFVDTEEATTPVRASDVVTTSPFRTKQENAPWRDLSLNEYQNMPIERDHVWPIHMGATLAPYVLLEPRYVSLPISRHGGELVKDEDGIDGVAPTALGRRMRRRWQSMNQLWRKHRNENTRIDLLTQIDYGGKLRAQRAQHIARPHRIVYGAAGHPTAALLNEDAIVDVRLVWVDCRTVEEAHYLLAILNSRVLEKAVEPFMSKGQYGPRDLVKHVWKLPIPAFDSEDQLHQELATAGDHAARAAETVFAELSVERGAKGQTMTVKVARREIRLWLDGSTEGKRADDLVARLIL